MRVISGEAGGIVLKAPRGTSTRPTTDKVKGAIFGMLGAVGGEGRVLDLFAGSGGLGIEALSRGADSCDFVDRAPDAVSAIAENVGRARLDAVARVVRGDALRFLGTVTHPYDLVLCDPPYAWAAMDALLAALARETVTRDGGVVVVETGRRDGALAPPPRLVVDRSRTHGDTVVTILRADG